MIERSIQIKNHHFSVSVRFQHFFRWKLNRGRQYKIEGTDAGYHLKTQQHMNICYGLGLTKMNFLIEKIRDWTLKAD